LSGEGRRIDHIGGHEDDFKLDTFLFVEAFVVGDLERQVTNMRFGDSDANLLWARLRIRTSRKEEPRDEGKKK
jgi:hypothetical protein